MRIVALVKAVPDTSGDRSIDRETGLSDRGASEPVLDEIGERSLEVALAHADRHPDTEVTLLAMTPESAQGSLRKGLAMGAGSAVRITDDGLVGADATLTATVLAAALQRIGFDLVIAGDLSTDGSAGVVPGMVAELLDVPSATNLRSVELTATTVSGERAIDDGIMRVTAELPAVISITERMPEARFPSFTGIMAAKKKPIEVLTLDELGVDPLDPASSRSIMLGVTPRPPREAGVTVVDEGGAGEQLADFLREQRLV